MAAVSALAGGGGASLFRFGSGGGVERVSTGRAVVAVSPVAVSSASEGADESGAGGAGGGIGPRAALGAGGAEVRSGDGRCGGPDVDAEGAGGGIDAPAFGLALLRAGGGTGWSLTSFGGA